MIAFTRLTFQKNRCLNPNRRSLGDAAYLSAFHAARNGKFTQRNYDLRMMH